MAVDARWLSSVRQKNQEQLGLAGGGMSGMGTSVSEQISAQFAAQRDRRTQLQAQKAAAEVAKIQAEKAPPVQPGGGPPVIAPLPQPSRLPGVLLAVSGVVALVGAGVLIYRQVRK